MAQISPGRKVDDLVCPYDLIPDAITGGRIFRTEHKDLAPLSTSLLNYHQWIGPPAPSFPLVPPPSPTPNSVIAHDSKVR